MTPLVIPPSLVLAALIAGFHGCLFFLLGGARGRHLLFYLALAGAAGFAGQTAAEALALPPLLNVGDCNVIAVAVSCWLGFALSRVLRSRAEVRTRA